MKSFGTAHQGTHVGSSDSTGNKPPAIVDAGMSAQMVAPTIGVSGADRSQGDSASLNPKVTKNLLKNLERGKILIGDFADPGSTPGASTRMFHAGKSRGTLLNFARQTKTKGDGNDGDDFLRGTSWWGRNGIDVMIDEMGRRASHWRKGGKPTKAKTNVVQMVKRVVDGVKNVIQFPSVQPLAQAA